MLQIAWNVPRRAQIALLVVGLLLAFSRLSAGEEADGSSGPGDLVRGLELLQQEDGIQAVNHFRAMVSTSPQDCFLHSYLASAYLKTGNLPWALREASAAAELCPSVPELEHNLAWVLSLVGEHDEALIQLESSPSGASSRLAARAGFIQGVADYKAGRLDRALERFEDIGEGLDPGLAEARDLYLDTISSMQGRRRGLLDLALVLASEWDSNVIQDSMGQALEKTSSFRFSGLVGLTFRPVRGAVTLESYLRGFQSFNTSEAADDFDATQVMAGAGLLSTRLANLSGGYDFRLTLLGGGSRVEQPDLYVFQEYHGGHLRGDLLSSKLFRISPLYTGGAKFHDRRKMDVQEHTLDLTMAWFPGETGDLKFFFIPGFSADFALGKLDSYDCLTPRVRLGVSSTLPRDLALSALVSGAWAGYWNSAGDFGISEARQDLILGARISLTWKLLDSLGVGFSYSFQSHGSNVDAYDYDRHIFGVSISENLL